MAYYLVTGGCGFIGSHLVDSLLKDGHKVRILDDLSTGKRNNVPDNSEIVVADVSDGKVVAECMKNIDKCFHLAAVASVKDSNNDWVRSHQINMIGSINIFNAARKNKTPVVYASSAAVYGDNADIPLKETSSLKPLSAYGADKLSTELHAQVASLVHGVPTTGLRFFNVYGPRQDPNSPYSGVISIFLKCVRDNKTITIFGDGEQTRDFIYVSDVICFLRKSMDKISRTSAVFNVCTGDSISINQLAKNIMSIADCRVEMKNQPSRKGDIRVSVGDPMFSMQSLRVTALQPVVYGLRLLIEDTLGSDERDGIIECSNAV